MADYGEAEDRAYAASCQAWERERFLSWVQRDESLTIDAPETTQDSKRRYSDPFVNDAAQWTDLPAAEDDDAKLPLDALTTYLPSPPADNRSFDIQNTDTRDLAFTASLRYQPRFEDSLESLRCLSQGDWLPTHEHGSDLLPSTRAQYPFVGPADLPLAVYRELPYSSEFVWDADGAGGGWASVNTTSRGWSDIGIHMMSPECSASRIEYNAHGDPLCGGGRVLFEVASYPDTDPSTSPAYDTALYPTLRPYSPDAAPDTPISISPPSTSSPLPCLHASLGPEVCTCLHCIFSSISKAVESRRKRDADLTNPNTVPRKRIRLDHPLYYRDDTSEPCTSVYSGHRAVSLQDESQLTLTTTAADPDPTDVACVCECDCECAIQAHLHAEVWGYAALSACMRCVKREEGGWVGC